MAAHCFDPNNKTRYVDKYVDAKIITFVFGYKFYLLLLQQICFDIFSAGTSAKCHVLKLLIYLWGNENVEHF